LSGNSLTGNTNQEETEAHQEGLLRKYRGDDGISTSSGSIVKVLMKGNKYQRRYAAMLIIEHIFY
jgi:hypothetical protein